ncbi:MAG: hypothetical protein V3S33_01975 [Gammaproteobacteria bacterium]
MNQLHNYPSNFARLFNAGHTHKAATTRTLKALAVVACLVFPATSAYAMTVTITGKPAIVGALSVNVAGVYTNFTITNVAADQLARISVVEGANGLSLTFTNAIITMTTDNNFNHIAYSHTVVTKPAFGFGAQIPTTWNGTGTWARAVAGSGQKLDWVNTVNLGAAPQNKLLSIPLGASGGFNQNGVGFNTQAGAGAFVLSGDFRFLEMSTGDKVTVPNSLALEVGDAPAIVPIPPAVALFASGLLGLLGMARTGRRGRSET